MKKNDWILLVSVLAYSFLFYRQFPGLNFLLFTLVLAVSLFIKDKRLWQKKEARLPLVGVLMSAVCILLYGDPLSIFANIVSLSLLAAQNMNSGNSIITAAMHAGFSYVSTPFFMIRDAIVRMSKRQQERDSAPKQGVLFYLIPVLMITLFFMFYRGSSVLFENLTNKIQLDFISMDIVFFTLGGLLLLYAFYYNKRLNLLVDIEQQQKDTIEQTGLATYTVFGLSIELPIERKSGIMMLGALNVLLFIVNMLDIQFLMLGSELPEGMTYSELVHQGIGSLILSIITAIAIILWYFKGEQNFAKDNVLKVLAYAWIAQNLFMICTSAYKNGLYIEESSLTHKRIGVFVYLMLAAIGLITTVYKLNNKKSAWYLIKTNAITFYVVLLCFCPVNWDVLIVQFNIKRSVELGKELDVEYLVSLSDKVIPDLYPHIQTNNKQNQKLKDRMRWRMCRIINDEKLVDWRSWCIDRKRIVNGIDQQFKSEIIGDLTSRIEYQVPYPQNIIGLSIVNPDHYPIWLPDLKGYQNLQSLDISRLDLKSLQGLPMFNQLRKLDVSSNQIENIKPVLQYSDLTELNVSANHLKVLPDMSGMQTLTKLDVSKNEIRDFKNLSALCNLEYLDMAYTMPDNFEFLLGMVNLKTLVINPYGETQLNAIKKILPEVKIEYPKAQ